MMKDGKMQKVASGHNGGFGEPATGDKGINNIKCQNKQMPSRILCGWEHHGGKPLMEPVLPTLTKRPKDALQHSILAQRKAILVHPFASILNHTR